MTFSEFHIALNVRDWHMARVNRFAAGKQRDGEDPRDLVRSLRICDAITDYVGDGLFPNIPGNLLWAVKGLGYVRAVA